MRLPSLRNVFSENTACELFLAADVWAWAERAGKTRRTERNSPDRERGDREDRTGCDKPG